MELDELWSFVRHKGNRRWVWLALCKGTRQVVACVIGGRGEATCKRLWRAIPKSYRQGVVYTDFWQAYRAVLPDEKHQAVGKETGLTNHVERFNNTLR
ncbi:MAG: IS1 family transposase, partial [Deinococcota bacterium]|nr:IS1 family transposase [Deinococcota bacterium]